MHGLTTLTGMRLALSVPDDFDFGNAVCSHGFFVLAPNRWDPHRQVLETCITLSESTAVAVRISRGNDGTLAIRGETALARNQQARVKMAVTRMLRLDEDLSAFHARCRLSESHRPAAEARFGRLLRSASLFEDVVKVICTCNVTWGQTVAMIDNIVRHWGVPAGPDGQPKGFPTPLRLASIGINELRRKARVGYRATFIRHLAESVATGDLELPALEGHPGPTEALVKALREIPGVGEYAAAHLCMLLGRYDRLAIDTELMRHVRTRHPRRTWTPAAIRRHYACWHPYQFLAYWFELWQGYADRHGRPEQWDPTVTGVRITAAP